MDHNQGIPDEDFKEILSSISGWYDRHGYINKLKVLYKGLVTEPDKLYAATKVIQLFELLCTSRHLSSANLTLLYDTINVTRPFGLEPEIWKLSTCFDIRTARISKIPQNRQILIKLIESLNENDLKYISQRHSCPQKADVWEFFLDLEQAKVICEKNLDDFMKNITTYLIVVSCNDPLGLRGTGDAATKDASSKKSAEGLEKLLVTDDTNATRKACTSTSTESQGKHIVTDETHATRNATSTSASTAEVCIVNNIMSQDNKGSIVGCQIGNTVGQLNIVNNITTLPANQESKDTDLSASGNNDVKIKNYLDQWQRKMYKNLNKMTPPTWNQMYEIDLADVFTDLELLKRKKQDDTSKTTLQELISLIQSQKSCKVLVEGKGGMGKTTLIRHLAYCWSNNRDNPFPGKIVFLVNLRDLKEDEDVIDVINRQFDSKDFCRTTKFNDTGLIVDFLRQHDDEIVLLLDGYDELAKNARDLVSLFDRRMLENSHVILTSRPENIDEIVKKCDVHVRVDGFSPDKIKFYIRRHFEYIEIPELGKSLIAELHLDLKNKENWGGRHREAFEMCRSPMLLLKICTVWKENQCLPVDMPTLFIEIFRCILNQYINRSGTEKPIRRFEDAPEKYVKAMLTLGKCMFKSLQNNRLSVNYSNLEGDEETKDLAIKLGFVYKEQPTVEDDFSEIFNTPHKLILESLVGFYLCRQTRSFSIDEGDTIRSNPYLHMSRVFAIGFLGADAGEFLKHWITDSANCYSPLERYFKVKKEHEEKVLLVLDEHMTKRIPDIMPHLEDVCTSLRDFLQHSLRSVEVIEDEPIFLLIKKINQHVFTGDVFVPTVKSWVKSVLSNNSFYNFGRKLAHMFFAIDFYDNLIECVDIYGHEDVIQGIGVEFEKFNFRYNMDFFTFYSNNLSTSALIHVLHYAPMLTYLSVVNCGISGKDVNEVIRAFLETGEELALQRLDLNENDLSDIDMASIISLLLVVPKLCIDMHKCCLSGSNVRDLVTEYKKNMHKKLRFPNVVKNSCFTVIRDREKCLKNCENDLSDIDGLSLAFLLQEISFTYPFKWNMHKLTCKNLQDLIQNCDEHNTRSNLALLDISDVDLSSISGADLAKLFTLFPKLNSLVLTGCKLSGNIIKNLLNELERTGDVLKLKIVDLFHNDLSDIDGSSLAKLLKVGVRYNLTTVNLCEFIYECISSHISFNWTHVSLCSINLSSVSGSTLSSLFKICPNLANLNMRSCGLTGKIISDFFNGCNVHGIVLTQNLIHLDGNNLSDIDGPTLTQLLMIININGDISYNWKKFHLTINNFHDLILECKRLDIVFNWTTVNLDGINISSISGSLLAYLFKICPSLNFLSMKHCNLCGSMIRDFLLECERESVVLRQDMLSLEGNDLSNIDGKSLAKVLQGACGFVQWISYNLCAENVQSFISECSGIQIGWTHLSLSKIDMSSLNGTTLASLFKIFPKLIHLDMQSCSVSGGFVGHLLNECERNGVELKDNMLSLGHNDLSDIDGASLAKLLKSETNCTWSDYKLNARNLEDLINVCENLKTTLKLTYINMCGINMSMINGAILASLLKICPNLNILNMEKCSVSGVTINSLLNECVEKKHMLQLKGNELSAIDSASLIKLINIVSGDDYDCFKWTDYKLSTDNLQDFIQTSLHSNITFGCNGIDLSGLALNIVGGDHILSSIFVIFPQLHVLSLNDCQLSLYLLSNMFKVCSEHNVISKVSILSLSRNDLSKVNGALVTSLAKTFPNLKELGMSNCKLTSYVFKHIARTCRSVVLPLTYLDISGNNLCDLNGADVMSLSSISPNLECLNVSGCNISSQLLQAVSDGFSGRNTLGLSELDISNNDLHDVSSVLLVSILKNSLKLEKLKLSKCRLAGKTIEEMLIHLPKNKSELCELDLSYNDLSSFNQILPDLFFSAFPFLSGLNLVNCQLPSVAYYCLKHIWPEVTIKRGFKYLKF